MNNTQQMLGMLSPTEIKMEPHDYDQDEVSFPIEHVLVLSPVLPIMNGGTGAICNSTGELLIFLHYT